MIVDAVNHLAERKGSSTYAIKKYMTSQYGIDMAKNRVLFNKTLNKAVSEGKLVQTKGTGATGSFKLPPKKKSRVEKENKEPKPKPTIKVKPVPKKTATEKPSRTNEKNKETKVRAASPKAANKPARKLSLVPTPRATLAKPPQKRSGKAVGKRILGAVNKAVIETEKPAMPKQKVVKASGRVGKIAKSNTSNNVKAAVKGVATKKSNAVVKKIQQSNDVSIKIGPESADDEQIPPEDELETDASDIGEEQSEEEYSE